ncbi:Retinol dehydrogenase 13 [Liparis tanakae]|uniref:Retinol dehydrogenase 13 n=1 Tax=Liparis tanakae TaxID=230148 RepID=A0A4Z2E4J6_9TELE|nr:Retinol dehydrogenase 13 [Liparis tanakae]
MACRDLVRAERAALEVRRASGNQNVVSRHLDLGSLYSVTQFAKDFTDGEERLDVLINNAGVMMCPRWLTEDGFETQLAVNHLGRIDFSDLSSSRKPYGSLESYRQSKLANVLFTRELARRLTGTRAPRGPHPGAHTQGPTPRGPPHPGPHTQGPTPRAPHPGAPHTQMAGRRL